MRLLLFLALLPSLLFAQSISVQPDHYLADRKGGVAPSPVFTIDKKDTALFGKGKQPKFILPKASGTNGFVFLYCPFCPPQHSLDGRILVYFTNIGQPDMRAYVDRNYNYDYTDEKEFVRAGADSSLLIELTSPLDPSNVLRIRYKLLSSRMDISRIPIALFAANPYYAGVNLSDRSYWFAADQLWIKAKDIIIGKDSICVAFFDLNLDGCFTSDEDMIALLPYGADSAHTTKYTGVRAISQGLILGFNGHAYEVKCDTSKCSPLTLTFRADLAAPVSLSVGDQLPHFSVQFFEGDSSDIYTKMQPGKYTYIEFWGIWCAGCRMIIPSLKSMNDTMSDRLTIISMDAYDNRQRAKEFVKENQMTWLQGYSNHSIEQLLYADDGFPYGILVDPTGKIVAFDVRPEKVVEVVMGK